MDSPVGLVVPEVEGLLLVVVAGAGLRVAGPLRVRAVLGAQLGRLVGDLAQSQELLTAHLPVLDPAVANLRTLRKYFWIHKMSLETLDADTLDWREVFNKFLQVSQALYD